MSLKLCSLVFCLVLLTGEAYSEVDSPNFKDGQFVNFEPVPEKGLWDLMKFWQGDWELWPKWLEVKKAPVPPKRLSENEYRITWINHASFLIQIGKVNILLDPHYSKTTFPVNFMGPARVHEPLVAYDDLPPIDVVFISHNHYDHMDSRTVKMLENNHKPVYIVGLENLSYLESFGVDHGRVIELDWWGEYQFLDVRFVFVPARHWSKRGAFDTKTSLWGALVMEKNDFKIYHGGDTGYGSHFEKTFRRLGPMNISLLPIGAYEPRWFMKAQHMNPQEAVKAHIDLKSAFSIGMHFRSFQLTYEKIDQPERDLKRELEKNKIKSFIHPKYGDFWEGNFPVLEN